jgi:SAM-dependent methyltransferase
MELNVLTLRHPMTLLRLALRKLIRTAKSRLRVVPAPSSTPVTADVVAQPESLIDVQRLISESSIEELNRTADAYFESLADWDYHLAKPFSTAADAPALLINFATVLQGLNLAPGLRLLDFGAGTGWTSRYLTQLGCEVIVLDVSAAALRIAEELYRRQPVIGQQADPQFLRFDGYEIDLPDASVDRILCFDSFHHAPNPDHVLREFARVLRPGGIAAFAEPGPKHSSTAQSQFEMRTYGVIENDVDIHAIWQTARDAGFADLRVAAYNIPPFHVSLNGFDDLLSGGETYLRWAESTRLFLTNVRDFFLIREGEEPYDSRRPAGLAASIDAEVVAPEDGRNVTVRAAVTNRGDALWLPSGVTPGGVSLGCHLYAAGGGLLAFDHHWESLSDPPRNIAPGERLELQFEMPPLPPGRYVLEFDCVADRVCWFAQQGSPVHRLELEVPPAR